MDALTPDPFAAVSLTSDLSPSGPQPGARPGPRAVHLCIDVQRLFAPQGPWPTPWLDHVLPTIAAVAERYAERTVFTRFVPPAAPDDAPGAWADYYRHWSDLTLGRIDPNLLELMPALDRLVPPARVLDKTAYSAFAGTGLAAALVAASIDTVVVTGAETDVCVLSTVLSAVDLGFRVVVVSDALCSSSDTTHDAAKAVYATRLSRQIVTLDAARLFELWPAP